jgi:hypothetical protein
MKLPAHPYVVSFSVSAVAAAAAIAVASRRSGTTRTVPDQSVNRIGGQVRLPCRAENSGWNEIHFHGPCWVMFIRDYNAASVRMGLWLVNLFRLHPAPLPVIWVVCCDHEESAGRLASQLSIDNDYVTTSVMEAVRVVNMIPSALYISGDKLVHCGPVPTPASFIGFVEACPHADIRSWLIRAMVPSHDENL